MKQERRVDLTFTGQEVKIYQKLEKIARVNGSSIQGEIKKLIK